MALTFFKTPKHKRFNYRPVYYDPKKEEREKRIKTAYEEAGKKGDVEYQEALRDRMQMRWKRNTGQREKKTSYMRLLVIWAVIAFVAYLIFFN